MVRSARGFSLLEMLVVVGIIGIMAAIGTVNYTNYTRRALTQQARVNLTQIYAAEMQFYSAQYSFSQCLLGMGFWPAFQTSYYYIGFSGAAGMTCGTTGDYNCLQLNYNGGPPPNAGGLCACAATANDASRGNPPMTHDCTGWWPNVALDAGWNPVPAGSVPTRNTFTAVARGVINRGVVDEWTIDHLKVMTRTSNGE